MRWVYAPSQYYGVGKLLFFIREVIIEMCNLHPVRVLQIREVISKPYLSKF